MSIHYTCLASKTDADTTDPGLIYILIADYTYMMTLNRRTTNWRLVKIGNINKGRAFKCKDLESYFNSISLRFDLKYAWTCLYMEARYNSAARRIQLRNEFKLQYVQEHSAMDYYWLSVDQLHALEKQLRFEQCAVMKFKDVVDAFRSL